mgnify:CR=1 FL=1
MGVYDGGDGGDLIEMDWLCKPGLPEKINLVKEEFAKERGLRPVKIFITGPPCSGKSFYGQQLAEHYNVPHNYYAPVTMMLRARRHLCAGRRSSTCR